MFQIAYTIFYDMSAKWLVTAMLNMMTWKKPQQREQEKANFLLVSGVTRVGEHLNVVTRFHHVMAHKCVDYGSLYHV